MEGISDHHCVEEAVFEEFKHGITSRPIYIATEPVDMRKSVDGLSAIVKNHFHCDPLTGHLFVFINRNADRIKMLYWEDDGCALWYRSGNFDLIIHEIAVTGNKRL